MTDIAARAIANALSLEVKKDGLQQRQNGDWSLRFTAQGIDMPDSLLKATMGQRYQCVLVAIDDDETPIENGERSPSRGPASEPLYRGGRTPPPDLNQRVLNGDGFDRDLNESEEVMPADQRSRHTETVPAPQQDKPVRARKPVAPEKRLAQQAGITCADPRFQRFVVDAGYTREQSEQAAAEVVRYLCMIKSRSEIVPDTRAAYYWDILWSRFVAWREAP